MPPDVMQSSGFLARAMVRFTRARAYQRLFASADGAQVLADLFQFCRVARPLPLTGDAFASGVEEGKRQVALRLARFINMTPDEMMRLAQEAERPPEDRG